MVTEIRIDTTEIKEFYDDLYVYAFHDMMIKARGLRASH